MTDDSRQCHAKSKQTGRRCKRIAAPGKRVCYMHGANAGPPKGNLNALIHGIYVKRVLDEQEQEVHDAFVKALRHDFQLNNSSDEVSAQMAAMAFLQYERAIKQGNAKAADIFDTMVLRHLKSLKATKISREGEKTTKLKTTPAEWAAALLKEVRAGKEKQSEEAKVDAPAPKGGPRAD